MGRSARLAVAGIAVLGTLAGCGNETDPPKAEVTTPEVGASEPTARDTTAIDDSFAGLPVGDPPELAYVRAGTSVVQGDRSTDLEWEVAAITRDLVYEETVGAIYRVGARGVALVTGAATSPPAYGGGDVAWIENETQIVHQQFQARARQPLPDGCCEGARVVGYDHDGDVFVTSPQRSWVWETYEGREGRDEIAGPPPDSEDHFWPVGGLGTGAVAGTGISSEVLVEYPGVEWGWGYVAGPRDPASDAPAEYLEQERLRAERVWLTLNGILALDPEGQLVVLGSEPRDDRASHHWRVLTGERNPLGLPDGLEVAGVVTENRRTVLVDATDDSGRRAWIRCHVGLFACAVATELGPDDIVPVS